MLARLIETLVPERLGQRFRWLLASSWMTQLGDGIAVAAAPLLIASQTHSPLLVSSGWLLGALPSLLFGLLAGALADRLDRRRLVMFADVIRTLVLVGLCLTLATGHVSVALVLIAVFVLGTAELFADTTTSTLTPMLVGRGDLATANSRLMTGFISMNQLAGPAIGAALFAIGSVVPFAVQAACVALGVVLVSRIGTTPRPEPSDQHLLRDIGEGLRLLWSMRNVRMLALVILAFNITWAAAWSVLVLWSLKVVHLGAAGFGLLTTTAALGGLVAPLAFPWLQRQLSLATLMRICLSLEVLTHLALALTTSGWTAFPIMFVFGAYAFVWGTVSTTVRQAVVPTEFQGRVTSAYGVCVTGGMVLGGLLGGLIAEHWGLRAPFWFAFAGAGLTLLAMWRSLRHIAREAAPVDALSKS